MPSLPARVISYYRLPPSGPGRLLILFIFINSLGFGMYVTAALLYLTRSVGLPTGQVGLALTVAGLIGLPANIPIGKLSDRIGPRGLAIGLLLVESTAMFALVAVRSIAVLTVVATVAAAAMQGGRTLRSVLTARVAGPQRQRMRAYTRSIANVAVGLGALAAGVAIQVDTRAAYLTVIVGNAVSYVISAGIVARLPRYPPIPTPAGGSRLPVLRNLPYMTITVLNLVMTFEYGVIAIAIPLWVVQQTQAPRATVAAVFLMSAILVALLQIRVGRRVENVAGAARMMRRAGAVFLLSCSAFAITGELSALWATVALLAITALHTVGELWHAAAVFELSYQLAPDHAQGEYQGVFALGIGASDALAPGLITFLCLVQAPQGWFALGALLALTGLLVAPAARWAGRHLTAGQPGHLAPSVT